ncbi:hypothetical protein CBS101457_006809 [Exobasidium rhododendri]|nr:hypothetical protein CBS101457_006809 [Exobasidium rhododendri]
MSSTDEDSSDEMPILPQKSIPAKRGRPSKDRVREMSSQGERRKLDLGESMLTLQSIGNTIKRKHDKLKEAYDGLERKIQTLTRKNAKLNAEVKEVRDAKVKAEQLERENAEYRQKLSKLERQARHAEENRVKNAEELNGRQAQSQVYLCPEAGPSVSSALDKGKAKEGGEIETHTGGQRSLSQVREEVRLARERHRILTELRNTAQANLTISKTATAKLACEFSNMLEEEKRLANEPLDG